MKTELVWEGKYDEFGNRRSVDIAGCSMPMQKIETIDEPRRQAIADGNLALFESQIRKQRTDDPSTGSTGSPQTSSGQAFRNMLIWGDNKLVMASLLKDFKGKIDLIYIDPPFDVGADFKMNVALGDENESVMKDQSTLEMVAYRDTWGKGTDSYIHMMYERLLILKDLLTDKGRL
jgi:adenine-specific DNA-methyltransferase